MQSVLMYPLFNLEDLKRISSINAKRMSGNKNITDFKVMRSLGKGSFGQVFLVKD